MTTAEIAEDLEAKEGAKAKAFSRKTKVTDSTRKRQANMPRPSAAKSGMAQAIFPSEKSTRNIPHPNAHGASHAKKPAKTSFHPGIARNETGTSGSPVFRFSTNALNNKYAESATSPMLPKRWTATMYGPGSNASKTYLVKSTRIATSAKWVTVKTSANARLEKNPLRRSRTDAARRVLACPGQAAWTNPRPTVSQNNPQNEGAEGFSTKFATPLSTLRNESAP